MRGAPWAFPAVPTDSPVPHDRDPHTDLESRGPGRDLARVADHSWLPTCDSPSGEKGAGQWESRPVSRDTTLGHTERNQGREPGDRAASRQGQPEEDWGPPSAAAADQHRLSQQQQWVQRRQNRFSGCFLRPRAQGHQGGSLGTQVSRSQLPLPAQASAPLLLGDPPSHAQCT